MSETDIERRRSAALKLLRSSDGWVPSQDLATFIGCSRDDVTRALAAPLNAGEIERQHIQGGSGGSKLSWRIAQPKPDGRSFSIDWPPGFTPQFDAVKVRRWGDSDRRP